MAKFLMLGKYSAEAMKEISPERTEIGTSIIRKHGGNLVEALILLGDYDVALYVELPGISEAIQVSVALNKFMGISFQTYPAITVAEFDKMLPVTL
ncbi:MAG: GYD domain-containing protein [Methanotrichaceae archaeon]|nr:GYD domain-containing protein [Methanotrichaceae archaeon]